MFSVKNLCFSSKPLFSSDVLYVWKDYKGISWVDSQPVDEKTLVILVLSQPWMALGANSWWTWDHDPYDPSFCYSDENFNVTMIRNFFGYISNDLVHHQLLNHKSNQLEDISFWCIWFIWPRTQQPKSLNLFPLYRMPVLGHVTFDLMIYPGQKQPGLPFFRELITALVWCGTFTWALEVDAPQKSRGCKGVSISWFPRSNHTWFLKILYFGFFSKWYIQSILILKLVGKAAPLFRDELFGASSRMGTVWRAAGTASHRKTMFAPWWKGTLLFTYSSKCCEECNGA